MNHKKKTRPRTEWEQGVYANNKTFLKFLPTTQVWRHAAVGGRAWINQKNTFMQAAHTHTGSVYSRINSDRHVNMFVPEVHWGCRD